MNLAIDVGNTLVKFGVFDLGQLQIKKTCIKKDFVSTLNDISKDFPHIDNAILATVGELNTSEYHLINDRFKLVHLDRQTKMPFENKYSTPETLGVDRLALISAAAQQYPQRDVLVIDAGTCITYDFINAQNHYLGGAISPGVSLRYQSLHSYTARLPLLNMMMPQNIIGDSTASSIHSGVVQGVLFEIDGAIDCYKKIYPALTVILTGGDTQFLRDNLKNDIFANSNFLLEGLNHILEYNLH